MECYSNGREQGYHIIKLRTESVKTTRICFSEDRSSDDIVVYASVEGPHFSMQGNVPDEKAYGNRKCFKYNEIDEAARYIRDLLVDSNSLRFIKSTE